MKLVDIKKQIDKSNLNEALTKTDELEIERLVKRTVKDTIQKELEKKVESLVKDQLKTNVSEKLIIQVVKNAMSSLYKTLWIRRATWLSGVENKEN